MSWFRAAPPRATHEVSVSEDHVLHVTEYGTPDGIPIVYLHGGPGGGTPPDARRLFDPERFRVVLFDQRGCGKSVCSDRLHGNTTDHLLADVEAVRAALGIECWAVMGSSYGSLLTALYAVRNPSRVRFALLHGVFLGSDAEVRWLYAEGGASMFYPKQWAAFEAAAAALQATPSPAPCQAGSPLSVPAILAAYHGALVPPGVSRAHPPPAAANGVEGGEGGEGGEGAVREMYAAAAALAAWEDEMETLAPCAAPHEAAELLAGAQVAAHHFLHGCFLPAEGALPELRAARETLASLPCAIIHGRHDVVCPPRAAAALHAAWPGSCLHIVEGGAHALFEKPMRAAAQACLVELTADLTGKRKRV